MLFRSPSCHTAGSPSLGGRSGPRAAEGPRLEAWRGLCDVTEGTPVGPAPQAEEGSGRPGGSARWGGLAEHLLCARRGAGS